MKTMRKMYLWIVLVCLSFTYLAGCASLGSKDVSFDYDSGIKGKMTARSKPAEPTRKKKVDLLEEGYLYLGAMFVSLDVPKKEKPRDKDATVVLLSEAAKKGGDLVQVSKDNEIGTRTTVQGGPCRGVYPCVSWDRVYSYGSQTVVESVGFIWRFEPEEAAIPLFIFAVRNGLIEKVRKAINGGLDVNTVDSYGGTALYYAALGGQAVVVKYLLSKGASVDKRTAFNGYTPLMVAKNAETVSALLAAGADVNAQAPFSKSKLSSSEFTPLMFAIRYGDLGPVKAILKAGPDVSLRNSDNMDAVDLARKYSAESVKTKKMYDLVRAYYELKELGTLTDEEFEIKMKNLK